VAVSRFNPDYPDAGLVQLVPSSITVGSGSGNVDGNGNITFSGVSSISLNSVFDSSIYNYWRVVIRNYGSVATNTRIKARVNTTDQSSGHYGCSYYADYTGGAAVFSSANNAAQATICAHSTSSVSLTLINADVTITAGGSNYVWTGTAWSGDGAKAWPNGIFYATTSFDGFTIFADSGNLTGTVRIYGYRK